MDGLIADLKMKKIVERLEAEYANAGAGSQTQSLPAAQAVGIVVLHFANDNALAGGELIQRQQISASQIALRGRNQMSMRIFERFSKVPGKGLFQPRRNGMFQGVGLGVHFAPIQSQNTRQKQFEEPMPADDAPSRGNAEIGQLRTAPNLVLNPSRLRQPFEHAADR